MAKSQTLSAQKALLIALAIVAVASIGALALQFLFYHQTAETSNHRALNQAIAEQQVDLVNQRVNGWAEQLESVNRYLAANPLPEGEAALASVKDSIQAALAGADSVQIARIGELGIASLRDSELQFNNHIETDMVRLAIESESAMPELYELDGSWVMAMSDTINDGDNKPVAVVLVRFPADAVLAGISDRGLTQLILTAGADRVAAASGSGNSTTVTATSELINKSWTLHYSAKGESIAQVQQPLTMLIAGIVIALIGACAAIILVYRLSSAAVEADLRAVIHYLKSLRKKDEEAQAPEIGLATAKEILVAVEKYADHLRKQAPVSVPQAETSSAVATANPPAPETKTATNGSEAMSNPMFQQEDVLDLESELEDVFDLDEEEAKPTQDSGGFQLTRDLPKSIFRAYDIRGNADRELTNNVVYSIARALGSRCLGLDQKSVLVGRDGRKSSERISTALIEGLKDSGCNVLDLGMCTTPVLYFGTHTLDTQSGVMVTGSHNPAIYNGLKMVVNGSVFADDDIQSLYQGILDGEFTEGKGKVSTRELIDNYCDEIIADVAIAQSLKVVVDASNGVAGLVAPRLLEEMGCEVVQLFCEIDGSFPNHEPDPSDPDNLQSLILAVRQNNADIGLAFDGDGDRLAAVGPDGRIVGGDEIMMLFAQDVVSRNPGADVIYDVKCKRQLNHVISTSGGRPIMWRSGHSYLKKKMAETGALLAGEYSGHFFFKERWFGFDDGVYSAARLLELLSISDPDISAQVAVFPQSISTDEIRLDCDDQSKFSVVERIARECEFEGGKKTVLDGVRVDFKDGWGLVRASNTNPYLTLRFDGDNQESLNRISNLFREQISALDTGLSLDF